MKHDQEKCERCRFWGKQQKWCNYGEIMSRSRLKDGGRLLPEGGCRLFEEDDPESDTQLILRQNWANGKTNGEAYARAMSDERREAAYRARRLRSNRRHPDEVYLKIEVLYREGRSDYGIAKEVGVSRSAVQRWRTVNGLSPNGAWKQ